MVTVSKHAALILTCLTLLPRTYTADNPFKAVGLSTAFGVILPTAIGLGTRYIENQLNIDTSKAWSADRHVELEASKAINTLMISSLSLMTWSVLRGVVAGDIGIASVLLSIYSYAQGRAFFMRQPSKLQKATSCLLPCAIGVVAYTRVWGIAPQLELAGKSILVLGLAHYGA